MVDFRGVMCHLSNVITALATLCLTEYDSDCPNQDLEVPEPRHD